ncbi:hypothetical protein ACLB2K_006288 [Fragaria x ananassa]
MESSSSPANFPRWAPSPSPSRLLLSPPVEDAKISKSTSAAHDSAENGVSLSCSSMERIFPFSIGFKSTTATSTAYASAVEKSLEAENAYVQRITGATDVELGSRENGISLTWEDLWVGVRNGKSGQKMILQGITGFAQPGEVLAIMGPSGCGKSTLLDALAGRLNSSTQQRGKILINGRKEKLAFGTSAYVTQDDTLMTTLTVREVVYYSAQLQLPNSMSKAAKKERAETTIREMGLQDSMDTRIGGWSRKGLSGGQKRRVMQHLTIEVFELFQNLCLLSSGSTVYFGPASQAEQFFASNGFPCPTLRNPSDHYLRTINKDFDVDIEQGHDGKTSTEEAINILIGSYKSSSTLKQVLHDVTEIHQQKGGALVKGSQSNFITQCLVLTKRSFVNMYRDLGYYWLRLAIYIALCLCVGTIFHHIGSNYGSIQARASMLMFVSGFLTFMSIGGFPSFVEDMKIFERERLNGHYGAAAFVVGNTFSSIPYLVMISSIPGAIAYYLVGLQNSFEHFVYFALVLFVCLILVESLMMIVASIVPDFLMGIITGAGIQGVMMLNGGFFRKPDDLPEAFWKYPMYHIGFPKYSNQGYYKNAFTGLTFPNDLGGGIITGEDILKNIWQVELGYSKWVDLAILFGMVLVYRLMFLGIIKFCEKVVPMIKALLAGLAKPNNAQISEITNPPSQTSM